jgi:hypothetical protein
LEAGLTQRNRASQIPAPVLPADPGTAPGIFGPASKPKGKPRAKAKAGK